MDIAECCRGLEDPVDMLEWSSGRVSCLLGMMSAMDDAFFSDIAPSESRWTDVVGAFRALQMAALFLECSMDKMADKLFSGNKKQETAALD